MVARLEPGAGERRRPLIRNVLLRAGRTDDAGSLLVTLELDASSATHFERLRRANYPPERNRVPAHVMLFHRLPAEREEGICDELSAVAAATRPFAVAVEPPRSIGSGVSYDLTAPVLLELHATLARAFRDDLIAQDRERYRPHVVVQNKVRPEAARATLAALRAVFVPFTARGTGLRLWRYRSGSWFDPRAFFFSENTAIRES